MRNNKPVRFVPTYGEGSYTTACSDEAELARDTLQVLEAVRSRLIAYKRKIEKKCVVRIHQDNMYWLMTSQGKAERFKAELSNEEYNFCQEAATRLTEFTTQDGNKMRVCEHCYRLDRAINFLASPITTNENGWIKMHVRDWLVFDNSGPADVFELLGWKYIDGTTGWRPPKNGLQPLEKGLYIPSAVLRSIPNKRKADFYSQQKQNRIKTTREDDPNAKGKDHSGSLSCTP